MKGVGSRIGLCVVRDKDGNIDWDVTNHNFNHLRHKVNGVKPELDNSDNTSNFVEYFLSFAKNKRERIGMLNELSFFFNFADDSVAEKLRLIVGPIESEIDTIW